ncbi:MAG: TadG family pilus assembly protein [Pseudomonadota bacterium]
MIRSIDRSIWRRILRDDRGAILPIMAAAVIVALSGAALAVDLARAHAIRQQLQLTADAAALAAAVNLPDVQAAREAAYRYAQRNMPGHKDVITAEGIEFGQWNPETRRVESDDQAPSAVRVTPALSDEKGNALSTLFAGVIGSSLLDLNASAVAGKRSAMCILALEQEQLHGLHLNWSSKIEAPNCTVQVNSEHKWAFSAWSGSELLAGGVCITGGVYLSFFGHNVSPEPTTGCPPQPDPLAALEAPEIGGCDFNDTALSEYNGTLHPGVYCGGLAISGSSDVDLAAGVYVIKDGPLSIADTAKMTGDEVTFFLTGDTALVNFSDNSELALTAPVNGDLAGILVYQDRKFGGNHIWDSGAPNTLHGTIYLPEGTLRSQSSNAITPVNSCNVLIAKQIHLDRNSSVSIDLSQDHCKQYLPSAVLGTVALLD